MAQNQRSKQARQYFEEGYGCAQAVLGTFAEDYGLSRSLAFKLTRHMGAGFMYEGGICGALAGAFMVYGLAYNAEIAEDELGKEIVYNLSMKHKEAFKQAFGGTNCREILGHDLSNPEEMEILRQKNLFHTLCPIFVEKSTELVEQNLIKNFQNHE
ncbi:MAG: C-GCAxxG-C-C family protein [Bacteroidales bacterium]|jgi:C_GCAxxG_C_C family probable redox protein|nr:C-GCAxxG-C-C family protein [Bacteroidales bacterium]